MFHHQARIDRAGSPFVSDEKMRILVVDDDPILLEFAEVYLASPGSTIVRASDGLEAWRAMASIEFDVALVDIEMPSLDGYGLVDRMRADPRLAHLPVIMVTGREDVLSIDRAYRVGATSFVTKPVNWRQIAYQVRYVVRASRMEREAVAARDEAMRVAAMRDNILAILGHEFRTPLNAIVGFSRLIASPDCMDVAKIREQAVMIAEAGETLTRHFADLQMISELLASSSNALRSDIYEVGNLVAEFKDRDRVALDLRGLGPLELDCDRARVRAALRHLVANALTHGGGTARVECSLEADGRLALSVTDDGPGMAPEQRAVAMTLFEQGVSPLRRTFGGLGIGLPLVKLAMSAHGGDFDLSSEPGRGTTAVLRFPAWRLARVSVAGAVA